MLKELILEKFNSGEIENLGIKRICEVFEAKSNLEKSIIRDVLTDLESEGKIVFKSGRFVLFENSGLIKGVLRGNERGFAFLISDSGDYFIPPRKLNGAFHGDTVIIAKSNSSRGSSDEGEVVRILERGITKLTGTFQGENGFGFVMPDDKNFFVDIYIPIKKTKGAKTGDKVFIEIVSYPDNRKNPEGKVLEILGKKYDLHAEELSIIKNAGLDLEFPYAVIKEAEKLSDVVLDGELLNRRDFRNDLVITIDGDDSRDFDDAISVKNNNDGTYTLYVHIADVSHYVKRGSPLDKEALSRSTSIYFPERVIPMLPPKLSNGICSLNEGVDRLTLSVIMTINQSGNVIDSEIVEGVIRSKKRMTYSFVQKMIDGDSEVIDKYKDIYPMILDAVALKDILSFKRQKRGNIDLKIEECNIIVNEKGKIEITPRSSVDAYKIIEEFMIATNETVAEYCFYMKLPFIYRIHEKPESEKLERFRNFLKVLGFNVKWGVETCHPKDFQTLLNTLTDSPLYNVVNKVMLRSMQKAKYSPENLGHFGLSSACYCHFTSPIRRYPDLAIHSIIKSMLKGENIEDIYGEFVKEASVTSSENERKADEVERSMDDYYKCRYMRSYIGEEFDGIISGVTGFGVFVELENTIEGIVKLETLPKGKYEYDEKTFTLSSSSRYYTLGEMVRVKILGVDMSARRIEFKIVEDKYYSKSGRFYLKED